MRAFISLFLLTWLLGITLGVNSLDTRQLIFITGGLAAFLTFKGLKYQFITVAVFLTLAGSVWSNQFLSANQLPENCLSGQVSSGIITKEVRLEEHRAQYQVTSLDGCRALITTSPRPVYGTGSKIELTGRSRSVLDMPSEYAGYAAYLTRQGVSSTMYYPEIIVIDNQKTWQSSMAVKLRYQVEKVFPEPVSGLVLTMTLAQRGVLPAAITEQFRKTGTAHILAISGLHMSLFAGMLLGLAMLLPLPPLIRTLIVIAILWIYVTLIGFPVSALRAVWFWTLFLLALRLGWLFSLPTVVILTATVLVTYNPFILLEVGFQLSVSAVTGIGLMLFLLKGLPHYHIFNATYALRDLIAVSLGAALVTGPLLAYHFGQLSLVSVLSNILVVPLVPVFLFTAILSILISFVMPSLAIMISFVVHLVWRWWDLSTGYISRLPGTYLENLDISLSVVVIYYLSLALIVNLIIKKQRRTWREIWQ